MDPNYARARRPDTMLAVLLLAQGCWALAPAPSTSAAPRTSYLGSLSSPATAEAEARAAAPARPPRAAEALQRAAAAPYLDSLDRRYLAELRSARERGEAGRYLASLGAANKLNELRSREAATTEHYLDGLDRSKWTATAFSRELERRRGGYVGHDVGAEVRVAKHPRRGVHGRDGVGLGKRRVRRKGQLQLDFFEGRRRKVESC